jgi:putative oxidoreductase
MDILFIVGRVLLGGFLLMNAFNHLSKSEALAGYASFKGVPQPRLAVMGSGVVLLLAGLGFILWMYVGWAVFFSALFLIPVSFKMHAFWNEGDNYASEKTAFMKNMAILGAILVIYSLI